MTSVKTWLGLPYPLGVTWLGNGVNFALFSEAATSVDLCLFDNIEARQENVRIPVTEHTDQVWYVFLPDARPGQLYGFRVSGPYGSMRSFELLKRRPLSGSYGPDTRKTYNCPGRVSGKETSQTWSVRSLNGIRTSSFVSSALSNKQSSTPLACSEKIAKFTPLPIQVAPSGYG